jgi:hypothetical protein
VASTFNLQASITSATCKPSGNGFTFSFAASDPEKDVVSVVTTQLQNVTMGTRTASPAGANAWTVALSSADVKIANVRLQVSIKDAGSGKTTTGYFTLGTLCG